MLSTYRAALPGMLIAAALVACSSPSTGTAAPAPTPAATKTAVAPATTDDDGTVCRSLERTGKPFYPTLGTLLRNEQLTIKPATLSAQLATLATTGVPDGSNETDGTAAINKASADLREKVTRMVRDADRLAQRYADAATGATVGSDITDIVNSFTDGLIACAKAGYPPIWFDPRALVG